MKKRFVFALLLAAALLLIASASAEEAKDLFRECKVKATVNPGQVYRLPNEGYNTYWDGTGGALNVTLPEGKLCQGVSFSFKRSATPLIAETQDENGEWRRIGEYREDHLNGYIPLNVENSFRIRAEDEQARLWLSRVMIWGEGELTAAQQWQDMQGEADMMLIVIHPDDDLIWFGGLLPTYVGQQGKKALVVYVVGEPSDQRKNELLDGLWTCGVRDYPVIGPFKDLRNDHESVIVKRWGGEDAVPAFLTGLIRRYRPKVVVTQDIKGEYGHMQHIAGVKAVIRTVTELTGDPEFDAESAEQYGVFTPQKLYLHAYRENEVVMDWTQPLAAFGGQTGEKIAAKALRQHISQRASNYRVYMSGKFDSQRLGLYFTTVGPDEKKNDIFEHVQ